ncbi:hypothetical protein HN014_15470 [Aquimarina sp. TRL1]|uniref:hypothetical protein n=1 Tax=Aquimarina sp. (strain TRL1) TaxID=2736252 RepID=UPI00158DB5D4|nr:hypothetical protein [Aquimarina sp. TRL1]QKX06250.1 hypothetical protein HN014_15470 [Aquimarina sp. TRL1]
MKSLNALIILWFVIQTLLACFFYFSSEREATFLFWIMVPFMIINCLGILFLQLNQTKIGAWMILISSAPFVPAGLIGVLGARKILDQLKEEELLKSLS